jgi:NHS family xanthosine MFS transporter
LFYGNPGDGLWMIIMSCVVYGMAFDFFIFQVHYLLKLLPTLEYVLAHRLFMMMSNGFGAFFGGIFSGIVIDLLLTMELGTGITFGFRLGMPW